MSAAKGYSVLTDDEVRVLRIAQGSITGNDELAKALDQALAAQRLPDSSIAQSKVSGLVSALAAKLTASQAANVAALGALAAVGTTDGSGGAGDAALATDVDARLLDLQAKIDAEIAALKTAGIQASV